jgi:preprotein translocase subunit Sec61beta
VDRAGNVGQYSSVTIGADGLGLISYYDETNGDLKVAHCSDSACTSATLTTVDRAGNVGQYSSVTIGADGLGLISYYDETNGDLKVAHCSDLTCTSATLTTLTFLQSEGNVGQFTSVTNAGGQGLISYYDSTDQDLKLALCPDLACTSATLTTTPDRAGNVGQYSSVTIGADGLGLISYYDETNGDLKVAHCSNKFCVPYHRPR